jgi:crotonobetaine/carnitine-CoA ligase
MTAEPTTLGELVRAQSDRFGHAPFLFFGDRTLSFADLDDQVERVARGLAELGAGPGTGVAVLMPNSPEWLIAFFAVQRLGAYTVPVNVALKGEGLRHVIGHSDAGILVTAAEYAEAVQAVTPGLPGLHRVVVDEQQASADWRRPSGWIALGELEGMAPGPITRRTAVTGGISTIMYTSGTTGAPKGVVSRYGGLNLSGMRMLAGGLQADDVLYTCLPLFHANALLLTTARALAAGRPMALARRFSASRLWEDTRRYGVTTFNALGAMVPILVKQPERPDDADNPVRTVFSAACPASVWAEFERRFDVRIIEGYAAVDGGGYMTINFGQSPPGSIGKAPGGWRIVDDDGRDVAVGETGELLFEVDDPTRRKVEYYKNEAAGSARIDGGWFRTGDLMRSDAEGNLYFVDRKTDSLRRRGENISSWEVERELDRHPALLESAVFGVPSELGEDEVMAVVVVKEGCQVTPEELVAFAEERMAAFMVPRFIEFRESLPKTETHRTRKGELKRQGVGPATWDRQASPSRADRGNPRAG